MATNQPERHIWVGEAIAMLQGESADVRDVAKLVVAQAAGQTRVYTLPINKDYESPSRIDKRRGVEYREEDGNLLNPREYELGVRAMGLRIRMDALVNDTLQAWVKRESARVGGNGNLARILLRNPDAKPSDHAYRAQIRKIQEWSTGKYVKPGGVNSVRVADYRGKPIRAANRILEAAQSLVGVTGHWAVYDVNDIRYQRADASDGQVPEPKEKRPQVSGPQGRRYQARLERAATAVLTGEADWVEVCERAFEETVHATVELMRLHGLHAEVKVA